MAKQDTPTITPEQRNRAAKEKQRRERIKKAGEALEATGAAFEKKGSTFLVTVGEDGERVELTPEQRDRAGSWPEQKGGLRKKALLTWILEGKGSGEVAAEARQKRQSEDRIAKNVTRSADPAASELAGKAKEFAGVRSAFLPKEGRQFLNLFTVQPSKPTGEEIHVKRAGLQGVEGGLEEAVFPSVALRAFAQGKDVEPETKKAIRAQLTGIGKDTQPALWGRKLAAYICVRAQDA